MTYLQLFFLGSGIMLFAPGCQLAGQTSPWESTNWKALTSLRYSSGFLPTGRSLIEECLTIPFLSIMQVALQETPTSPSSQRQPQALEMSLLRSETRGMSMGPSPPSFLDLRVYSMCENLESTETAMTSHPISLNYLALLLKAMISVGQTKVKSRGQKKRTTYFPWQDLMSMSTKLSWNQAGALKWGAGFLMRDISQLKYDQKSKQDQLIILIPTFQNPQTTYPSLQNQSQWSCTNHASLTRPVGGLYLADLHLVTTDTQAHKIPNDSVDR